MNAGLLTLQDGSACLAFEGELPFPLKHVEFNPEDYRITLVFDRPRAPGKSMFTQKKEARTFDFPVDPLFANLFKISSTISVAQIIDGQLIDIHLYSLVYLH